MRRVSGVLATLLLLPVAGYAAVRSVTLDEAIAQALQRNHLLKSGQHTRAAARAGLAASQSRYLPRISFEESFAAANTPSRVFMMKLDQGRIGAGDFTPGAMNDPASTSDFRTLLTLEQPLFDASISRAVAVAREADAAEEWRLARLREETGFQVFVAYQQILRAKLQLEVANGAVESAREHERLAQVRNAAGVGLKADELRARSFLAEMQQQSIAARNTLELARLELARRLGEPPGTALEITTPAATTPIATSSAPLIEQALVTRQDLRAMERWVAQADGEVQKSRGEYLPTLYGSAGYQLNDRTTPFGRDNDGWFAGASLRWEIFDGMRSHAVEQASLRQRAAEAQLAEYRNAVAHQVTESVMRYDEAGKRLEMARQDLLAAEEGVRLVQKRYENSLSLFIELLDAQMNLNRSRAQLVEQETAFALAVAQVRHSVGIFLKEAGQ